MRKLLLIAMLAVTTMAWAHGAKKGDQARADQTRGGTDWYQAMLNPQINHWSTLNKPEVIEPPSIAFSRGEPGTFQAPATMAAREGGQASDWYDQKVKVAADVNQADLQSLREAPELDKNAKPRTR